MGGFSQNVMRNHLSKRIQLSPNFSLTACSDDPDFIPSSFKIEAQGKSIYIDPYHINDTTPADYILITHAHPDHLSLPDISKIVKKETLIICPQMFVEKLSVYKIKKVKPGDALDLVDFKCEVVAAYNRWLPVHLKLFKFVGYILTLNGMRIYHAGDTDFIPEMKGIKNITIAMVPIGVGLLAMNPEQAAAAINAIKPLIAVPMHYKLGMNNAEKFKQFVDKDIKVEIME